MIEIADVVFKTKKEAEIFIQNILYRYEIDTPLSDKDRDFLLSLLESHPDKESKKGIGVHSVIIEKDSLFNKTRHFTLIRNDNSKVDFSYKKCLTANLNDPSKLFRAAARRVVSQQIIDFRDLYFQTNQNIEMKVVCQLTGILISKNDSHVDHIPPNTFDKIVTDFINQYQINIRQVTFSESPEGIGTVFVDETLKENFYNYHKLMSQLRVVSQSVNLKQKRSF